jgi:hypothetical protein
MSANSSAKTMSFITYQSSEDFFIKISKLLGTLTKRSQKEQ